MGCTEPVAVSLCVAKAVETLGRQPETIDVQLSANMLKNAMGVGIPGTGMVGLPIAIALGALVGKSEYKLEVLRDVTPEAVDRGKEMISENRISVSLKSGDCDKLFIEAHVKAGDSTAVAIIAGDHTHFVMVEKNGEVIFSADSKGENDSETEEVALTLHDVYDFATTTPLEEIAFINEAAKLNSEASRLSLLGNYGHEL